MSDSKIEFLEINGKTILIEMEEVSIESSLFKAMPDGASNMPALPHGSEYTGVGDTFRDISSRITDTLEAVVGSVEQGIRKVKPDEWEIVLSIGFAGSKEFKAPFIKANGKTDGGIKITAKWKNDKKIDKQD